jgi:hypothetical protein
VRVHPGYLWVYPWEYPQGPAPVGPGTHRVTSLRIQVLIFLLAGKPVGTWIGIIFFYFLLGWSLDPNLLLFLQVQPFNQNLGQNVPVLLNRQLPNSLFLHGQVQFPCFLTLRFLSPRPANTQFSSRHLSGLPFLARSSLGECLI